MLSQQINIKEILHKYLNNILEYIKEGRSNIQKYRMIQLLNEVVKMEDKKINQCLGVNNMFITLLGVVEENKENNLIQI